MDPRNIIILRFHRLDRRQRRHMNFAEANGQRAADYAKAAGLRGMGKLEGSNHAEDVALGCSWCQMISILLHVSSSHFQIVFFSISVQICILLYMFVTFTIFAF